MDSCFVPGGGPRANVLGYESFPFKMSELARLFSKVFLGLTFPDSEAFDTDSFSCCKISKSLTILTWPLRGVQLPPHKYSPSGSVVFGFTKNHGGPTLKLTKKSDSLQEVNTLILHETLTRNR